MNNDAHALTIDQSTTVKRIAAPTLDVCALFEERESLPIIDECTIPQFFMPRCPQIPVRRMKMLKC